MTAALLAAALSVGPPGQGARAAAAAINSDRAQPSPAVTQRVGTIRIEGNSRTGDRSILALFPPAFDPGRPLPSRAEFDKLERRLLVKFAGRLDVDAGRWPTVTLSPADADGPFRDVVVRFPERGPGER